HHAQVRRQGRERIVRDLRPRRRDRRQQRGLPGVRLADQPHVRDQLQLQRNPALLPFLPRLPVCRRPPRRRGEGRVSAPAPPAPGNDDLVAVLDQLPEQLARVRIPDHGARWNAQDQVLAVAARAVLPLAVLPPFRPVVLLVTVVQGVGRVLVRPVLAVAPLPPTPPHCPPARPAPRPPDRARRAP